MDVIQLKHYKKTKLYSIFFCLGFIFNCNQISKIDNETINYEEGKAISISFRSNEKTDELKITLKDNNTDIIGDLFSEGTMVTFKPIVPFTNGQDYQIKYQNKVVLDYKIAPSIQESIPELLAIYPNVDYVPENLLKMYFKFSQPMQEVKSSLDFIKVFDKTENKEVDVFLELETELWNKEHMLLTLWLDPGRIKKDLIPNKEKGLPILKDHEYSITVSENFKTANANNLKQNYIKEFSVGPQDKEKPSTHDWYINTPNSQKESLKIIFNQPLDVIIVNEVFSIYNSYNKLVEGTFLFQKNGFSTEFLPSENWKPGNYLIKIESRLEDLAGNNLNRLFERDLENTSENFKETEYKTIQFTIN